MAKNRVQNGRRITADPGATVSSGDVVVIGDLVCVALVDGVAGTPIEFAVSEVYDLPKAVATAFAQGVGVSWDASAGEVVAAPIAMPAAGDVQNFGIAWEAAINGNATVAIHLTPGTGATT